MPDTSWQWLASTNAHCQELPHSVASSPCIVAYIVCENRNLLKDTACSTRFWHFLVGISSSSAREPDIASFYYCLWNYTTAVFFSEDVWHRARGIAFDKRVEECKDPVSERTRCYRDIQVGKNFDCFAWNTNTIPTMDSNAILTVNRRTWSHYLVTFLHVQGWIEIWTYRQIKIDR